MWKYNHTDELFHSGMYYGYDDTGSLAHHGVLGMKWGVRRARKIQARKDKAKQKYEAVAKKHPNSRKANKARIRYEKIKASRYGKTTGKIVGKGVMNHLASLGIQGAGALALTPLALSNPATAGLAAAALAGGSTAYQVGNAVSTAYKALKNYQPQTKHSNKQNKKKRK